MKKILIILIILLPSISVAMVPLDDSELVEITGQSLLVADFIEAGSISGQDPDMSFFRMGLDGIVEMNMNIDKLQLGCGGFNEVIATGCDIDIDYVRLMGLNAERDGPGEPVASDFILTRPYFEIAISENANGEREVAGFKIGAEKAEGYMGIGRRYADGQENLEHGGTCTNAREGGGALNCHSGINQLSGFLTLDISGRAEGCFRIIFCLNGNGPVAKFGAKEGTDAVIQNRTGTRMSSVHLDFNVAAFLFDLRIKANINESLRFIHGMVVDSEDFFLSFQRQAIKYPKYTKDAVASVANAGWWMNIPHIEISGLSANVGTVGVGAIGGMNLTNAELNQTPPKNCYGSYNFC